MKKIEDLEAENSVLSERLDKITGLVLNLENFVNGYLRFDLGAEDFVLKRKVQKVVDLVLNTNTKQEDK